MKRLLLVSISVSMVTATAEDVILGPPPTRFDKIQNYDYIYQRPKLPAQPQVTVPMAPVAHPPAQPAIVPPLKMEAAKPAAPPTTPEKAIPPSMEVKTAPEQGVYSAGARTQLDKGAPSAQASEESMMMDPAAGKGEEKTADLKTDTAIKDPNLAPNQAPAEFQQLDQMPDESSTMTVPPKVFVTVDKSTQTITIESPEGIVTDKVSTGGGLKTPQGKNAKGPYCANNDTPNIPGRSVPGELINGERWLWIPAIESDEAFRIYTYGLEGPGSKTLTPSAVPKMSRVHYSQTFEDEAGNTVPMPFAIRIHGGIFFHEALPGYMKHLGRNVSGGCIRLSSKTARALYGTHAYAHDRKGRRYRTGETDSLGLMKKYGGIAVRILGDNPAVSYEPYLNKKGLAWQPGDGTKYRNRAYCTPQMASHVRDRKKDAEIRGKSFSPVGSIGDFFSSIFGGGSSSTKPKKKKSSNTGLQGLFN